MLLRLLLLFTVIPMLELILLLRIAEWTGWEAAAGVVIGTGVLGGILLRVEGVGAVRRIRGDLNAGRLPANSLLDGLLILVGAAFLITPGVLTDLAGVLLLLPPTRRVARGCLKRWVKKHFRVETFGGPADADWRDAPLGRNPEEPPKTP